jgi:methylase of polypeptide subunit release factors
MIESFVPNFTLLIGNPPYVEHEKTEEKNKISKCSARAKIVAATPQFMPQMSS